MSVAISRDALFAHNPFRWQSRYCLPLTDLRISNRFLFFPRCSKCWMSVVSQGFSLLVMRGLPLTAVSSSHDEFYVLELHMWPTLTKGLQSHWEYHKIIGENITKGSWYPLIVFDFFSHIVGLLFYRFVFDCFSHIVGLLFYHFLAVRRPFWPSDNFKTHFNETNSLFWLMRCQSLQLYLSQNGYYHHLTWRRHNFTAALCTALKLLSN